MWKQDTVTINGVAYKYYAKVYEVGSEHGIDGGKVSKLTITRKDDIVYNYDRGLDIPPVDEETKFALKIILNMEN